MEYRGTVAHGPHQLRANRSQLHRDALLDELRQRFPDAHPCVFATDGIMLGRKGDPARALVDLQRALAIARSTGGKRTILMALENLDDRALETTRRRRR